MQPHRQEQHLLTIGQYEEIKFKTPSFPVGEHILDMPGVRHNNRGMEYTLSDATFRSGQDQFHPLSKRGSQMSPNGLGWIIIDSLDTLMIMNRTTELAEARRWISRKLDYNQTQDVNTFETTIRMLGGLLSAHYLSQTLPQASSSRDYVYLKQAVGLADRLLGAYDSPSGLPYTSIDLRTGKGILSHSDGGASSTAEATTLQLEMKYLANLTGNGVYWRKAEHVMKVIDDNSPQDGLVPIFINPETGRFTSREVRLGSRGDSYYGTSLVFPNKTSVFSVLTSW